MKRRKPITIAKIRRTLRNNCLSGRMANRELWTTVIARREHNAKRMEEKNDRS